MPTHVTGLGLLGQSPPGGIQPSDIEGLRRGDKGDRVRTLQKLLNFYAASKCIRADGDFGPVTERRLKAWERANDHDPDGSVDYNNAVLLTGSGFIQWSDVDAAQGDCCSVWRGQRSFYVGCSQLALQAQGFDPQGIDGVYGGDTQNAVKAWQRAKGRQQRGCLPDRDYVALTTAYDGRCDAELDGKTGKPVGQGKPKAPAPDKLPSEAAAGGGGMLAILLLAAGAYLATREDGELGGVDCGCRG